MHKIDTPTATLAGTFTEGSPQGGIPATEFSADWCNSVQAELANVIEASGLELDKLNNAQLLEAVSRMLLGREQFGNHFINGDFALWQRGSAFTVGHPVVYGPDRFFLRADGASGPGIASVSRQLFPTITTTPPGNPRHFARFQQTTPATVDTPRIGQRIEELRQYFNTPMAVSFWAKSDVAMLGHLVVERNFGSGGSPVDVVHTEEFAVTEGWQQFQFYPQLPASDGEVLGPNSFLGIRIELPTLLAYSFDVADFLVQRGSFLNPYPRVPKAVEMIRAARYFEKSYAVDVAPGTTGVGGYVTREEGIGDEVFSIASRFRVEKRAVPNVTWYSPSTGFADRVDTGVPPGTARTVTDELEESTDGTGYVQITPDLGGGTTQVRGHWTADAELY